MNNAYQNPQNQNYVICRASDVLKLLKTKEDRINIAKENSNKILIK